MDLYKKKTLKFEHKRISRDFRHAETLKARETSRFKRLSMIRSMGDSMEVNDSVEIAKENIDVCQQTRNGKKLLTETSKKPSRLEMLQKWKQDKLLKKEMDMKTKTKPFYAGSSRNQLSSLQFRNPALESSQSLKSSFINQSKINVSRSGSSKVLPKPSFQPSKAPSNSKLMAPRAFQSSRIPNSRPTDCVAKAGAINNKATNMATIGKKANNIKAKHDIIGPNKGNSIRPVIGGIKPPLTKATPTSLNCPRQNESSTSKVTSQGLSFPKPTFSRPLSKPTQKVVPTISKPVSGIPAKSSKGIPVRPPKQIPTICMNPRTNNLKAPNKSVLKNSEPVQNIAIRRRPGEKVPVAGVKQEESVKETSMKSELDMSLLEPPDFDKIKQVIDAKMQAMELKKQDKDNEGCGSGGEDPVINEDLLENVVSKSLVKDNDEQIRNDSFRSTIVEENLSGQCDISEANDVQVSTSSPVNEILTKYQFDDPLILLQEAPDINQIKQVIENKLQSLKLEQAMQDGGKNLESIPDLTLNCDLSVINSETSFAPLGFKFQPPTGLSAFLFDDVCEAVENRSFKFLSRTSTPTREASERASDLCSKAHKSSTGKDSPLKNESPQKLSNDLPNEIIADTDNPFQMASHNDELLISEVPDILVNNETFEDEEEILKEDLWEKSPGSFLGKEDVEKKTNNDEMSCKYSVNEISTSNQAKESAISLPETPNIVQNKHVEAQMQSRKLEQEKQNRGDVSTEKEISNYKGKKSTGAISKRVSVQRKSVLHSIAETCEAEELICKTPVKNMKSQNSPCTPRRSLRLLSQNSQALDDHSESAIKEDPFLITPVARRSQRLLKSIPRNFEFDDDVLSPFKARKSSYFNFTPRRRSMRLVDFTSNDETLNTPEKSESADQYKTNITADFQKLALNSNENSDPNVCLIDFENSPEPVLTVNSRKVSLLYSPERRKSMRKSIRGDLMSFSPNTK